jgi:YVTN family beta-propeller protein
VAVALLTAVVAGVLILTSHGRSPARIATGTTIASSPAALSRPVRHVTRLVDRVGPPLSAPVQDAAAASFGGRAILLGGLTAADTSTDEILAATASGSRVIGRLPSARHDTAAAAIGGSVYLFGGGNGVAQLDDIVRVDPETGQAAVIGHLPAASSDSSAAAIDGTAYVVGGFTGTQWLDTIVAFTPGRPVRIVAHLPEPVRYAAVTSAAGRLVIAGGSLENGTASSAVLEFDPGTRRVVRLGTLPAPTTHAAGVTIGSVAYVIGGRGALLDTPTDRIVSVDVGTKRIRVAGMLRSPRSDLSAAALGNRILVVGGRDAVATQATVNTLTVTSMVVPVRSTATAKATDVYAHDGASMLSPVARLALPRIYVPNSESNTVDVIDPQTYKVVEHFSVGALPQHVVPAWNLKTLYVTNDIGNSLTPINPRTGKPGTPIPVDDPYNMYFTPSGRYAIVVAERLGRLDFRNAHTFRLHRSVPVPCSGVDHMDFSADGSYLIASCEFSGQLVKVNVAEEKVVGVLTLPDGSTGMPQDVKLSPDGKVFYVADMMANGVWEINGATLKVIGFLHTGAGAHGLYPSRNSKLLYVTNRSEGSISVVSFRTRKVVAKWRIPGGGSPDMGGVSADGKVLWLSGRYNSVVYAISTTNGRLLAKIPVGSGPHGLCVWPQPGRYSLGHTGILR